ncbi:tRNA glutamyl-Q(34) synthetase GluQRS [Neptunomonas sp. CHC150]|uniref:tRNA glutamyl-Q(34) synthetase GluQRS n=1 Tax=Neptunomonas sp. CHC150 TaxID=2998324 RepID=UPI0025B05855|nr:tRNA glutamyl-Q(34) synthetase GluQRS [Neptunomonas sp. CHC150]MDN2659064.1 tRNA glutamyl-Q(34) synthetase GluQRS [Neptunomonas sp. CHC150]
MYIGRFAPSPTGPLHFGSLIAALASYADARSSGGQWLVRIENTDPPREVPESTHQILQTLEAYGFEWDGNVVWQHLQHDKYQAVLDKMVLERLAYPCDCSRKQIMQRHHSNRYDNYCRHRDAVSTPSAMRFKAQDSYNAHVKEQWSDRIQGLVTSSCSDDFILKRKDGLWAYQLAVVVDDIESQITHVVRGSDLLHETPKQMQLQIALNAPTPSYAHIPIATSKTGQKLSKQNLARAIQPHESSKLLTEALVFLNQIVDPDWSAASPHEILQQAIKNWDMTRIPQQLALVREKG